MADEKQSFFSELRRRNVYRVGIAYLIVAWLTLQVVDVTSPILELPAWVPKLVLLLLLIGFPLALFFSWAYELTPDGLKRETEVDRSRSIVTNTGKRLNQFTLIFLAAAVLFLLADKFYLSSPAVVDEVAVVSEKPSIAVLPFVNMSAEDSSQYFSDGLADTLLHMLAQINGIRVAARTSSFQFRDQNMDMSLIGEQLQVSSVLEGSVQRSGNKIRVTAQLINANDGFHLWSGTFDRDLDDVFAIQDEIANEVVAALQVSLLGNEIERLNRRPTENVEAYTEYMLGVAGIERFSFESLPQAEAHFASAISLDPQYALAYARLAQTYIEMFDTGLITYDALIEKATASVEAALRLDPNNVDGIGSKGALADIQGDAATAERLFRRAIALAPNEILSRTYLVRFLQDQDRLEEALEELVATLELDPLSQRALGRASSINLQLKRYDKARLAAERIRQVDPLSPSGYYLQAFVDWQQGELVSAIRWMIRAQEVDPNDPELPIQIGDWYMDMVDFDTTKYWYEVAIAVDPNHPMSATAMLYLDIVRGENLQASAELSTRLLENNIDNRKGSRGMALVMLALRAEVSGDFSDYLRWIETDYPEYFMDPPRAPLDHDVVRAARIAYALCKAGKSEQATRLAEFAMNSVLERGYDGTWVSETLLVAFLLKDDIVVEQSIQALRDNLRWIGTWDMQDHIHPWVGDYSDNESYLALKSEWYAFAAERRQRVNDALGPPGSRPSFDKKL